MANSTNNDCECNTDCTKDIPEGSILPTIPPSNIRTPDEPSLLFLPKVVRQTVTEKQQTSLDTKEAASSHSKDISCDVGVEEANTVTQTTSGGGSTGRQSVPQSLSFSITIPVYHNT